MDGERESLQSKKKTKGAEEARIEKETRREKKKKSRERWQRLS